MTNTKERLNYYGGGYSKGSNFTGVLLVSVVTLLALAILFDPLGLSGVGTYTSTDSYIRCDAGLRDEYGDGTLIGYSCREVREPVTYGLPGTFATIFYTAILLGATLVIFILATPQRAMDKLAHKLAVAKTLGLLEEDKE